jgi:hypothetical protein
MRPDELFSVLRPDYGSSKYLHENELFLEFMFWIVAALLTLILLRTRPSIFQTIEGYGKRLSRKRGLVIVIVMFAAFALRALALLVIPIPEAWIHDEHSYLLQAKTFASGRLTNPTPAGWEHLEAFHVNMRPTYQSMYPPGQALFLAAADVVHANPWWGVWLSVGLMCGAICWMLQGWLPPQWALLGGLFCVIRFSIFSYWANSYFGGAVAAMGGALVLGSLPRLRRNPKVRYGLLFALGLGILANTRAYEGFIFSIPAMIALAFWFLPAWKRGRVKISLLVPAVGLLLVVGAAMGYYNWRVTGRPLTMPYIVNQQQYHITKPFVWQTRYDIPEYRHQVMRTFYVFHEMPGYLNRRNPGFYSEMAGERVEVYYDFYIWPMMIPAVFAVWVMMKSRKMRIFPLTLLLLSIGLLVEQWPPEAHYAAPMLGVAITIVLYGLRLVWTWKPRGMPVGPMLVRGAVIVLLAQTFITIGGMALDPYQLFDKYGMRGQQLERARLMAQMEHIPGQHLVFVHFHLRDTGNNFWIYNDPDPAQSKIVWAHDMGDTENQELIRLYPNRHVWFIDKIDGINVLTPYPDASEPTGTLQLSLHSDQSKQTHEQ